MSNFTRKFWRELGIMFFAAECQKGESFTFVSPVRDFTLETPTVPVVVSGKFRGYSEYRDPVEWPALPTKTEGGIAFPGQHTLEALEDTSIYACVCHLPAQLTEVSEDMFKLDHLFISESASVEFLSSDGYKAVIVMSGVVTTEEGRELAAGSKVVVPEGSMTLQVQPNAHLVGYRLEGG